MSQRIVIDPVTRIEGHAKITVHMDEQGFVEEARLHIAEFRGFERFCEGRPFWEMPGITARICGICPVSHLLASAKTGDGLMAVDIPVAADKLRRLMNMGQFVQSHALSFFHLSSPDLLMGMDSDPAQRNIAGILAKDPALARRGIRLRQFGQEIIELLGGRKIHPAWAVPGGVRSGLNTEGVAHIKGKLDEMFETTKIALKLYKDSIDTHREDVDCFGTMPTMFFSLVSPNGDWEHHGGILRFIDSGGSIVADRVDPLKYQDYIGEAVETWSYLKFPYFKPAGYPGGIYRVGPLARLNICSRMGTPLADAELDEFRNRCGHIVSSSFHYHYARLIEILACLERIAILMDDPDLQSTHLRANAGVNRNEAVGVSEAPRGTLLHHYKVDDDGKVTAVNLIIATGQNNLAMNRTVSQIARHYIRGGEIREGVLNRMEAGVRAYDPCLSCSTHAAGQMPMHIQLFDNNGNLVNEIKRS